MPTGTMPALDPTEVGIWSELRPVERPTTPSETPERRRSNNEELQVLQS